jgi:hypothetical protein
VAQQQQQPDSSPSPSFSFRRFTTEIITTVDVMCENEYFLEYSNARECAEQRKNSMILSMTHDALNLVK